MELHTALHSHVKWEAAMYALVKCAAHTKGLTSMMADYGISTTGTVCTDATAAIGMAHRQGLGKTRHVDVQYLWIQQEIAERRFALEKVRTDANPADLFTTPLNREVIDKHLVTLGVQWYRARARGALTVWAAI